MQKFPFLFIILIRFTNRLDRSTMILLCVTGCASDMFPFNEPTQQCFQIVLASFIFLKMNLLCLDLQSLTLLDTPVMKQTNANTIYCGKSERSHVSNYRYEYIETSTKLVVNKKFCYYFNVAAKSINTFNKELQIKKVFP